jgi:hypothetical protein
VNPWLKAHSNPYVKNRTVIRWNAYLSAF